MKAVPRLERFLSALIKPTNLKQPRKILMRVRDRATSWYLLGGASHYRFGSGLFTKGNLILKLEDLSRYEK